MKKFNLICIVLLSFIFAEDIDILNLKNGDLIKGKIIENKINEYIKIELQGGSVLTYTYDQIESIEREEDTGTYPSNTSNNQTQYNVSNNSNSTNTIMKGTKNIGGLVKYSKNSLDGDAYGSSLLISPSVGYFLTNNMSVNIDLGYSSYKYEDDESGDKNNYTSLSIGGRYHFPLNFGLGYVGLHYMNYKGYYKSGDYSNSYTDEGSMIESGVLLGLNDFVYLDFGINYETYNDHESGETSNYLFFDVGVSAFIK